MATLIGTTGNNTINGTGGRDLIRGLKGNDVLSGRGGSDKIFGGAGRDFISGGRGNDKAYGGRGDDFIRGNEGDDLLFAGAGNDELRGEEGNDRLTAGAGTDVLVGGSGNDILIGNVGSRTVFSLQYYVEQAGEPSIVDEFSAARNGTDQVYNFDASTDLIQLDFNLAFDPADVDPGGFGTPRGLITQQGNRLMLGSDVLMEFINPVGGSLSLTADNFVYLSDPI